MKVFLGFSFHTAYLSVTYLDRFLLQRSINEEKLWAIRLLSVACLSLAAKMDELIVPSLSEYRIDDYRFESSAVQRMELLVLNTLEWRMRSVTPFDYLDYFASKFGCKSKVSLCKEAAELILIVIEGNAEMNLMDHRPSAIAAAAILTALDEEVTEKLLEFKMGAMSSIGSIEIEHVFSCYNTMQEFQMRKNKVTNLFTSSDLASPTCTSNNNSSIDVSSVATKRRLGSNVCDCDFGIDKKTRLD
ncbi:Cyclin-D5-3 [Acorus gramineus]|uniref:Cyclin-D5-3 n=1 Tax=Acorus gramineus TaxID=55184 RepID=A0AAV9AXA5_ACOGR|nr:Cyclin-D5-3 [Acorus gramineus]